MCEWLSVLDGSTWSNVSSGTLGAILGSLVSVSGIIWQQGRNDRAVIVRKKTELVGFLDALLEEMKVLWELHMKQTGQMLTALPDGEPFMWQYPAKDEVFTIYNSAAHRVSEITNSILRHRIVKVYALSKALVSGFQLNNHFDEARQEALIRRSTQPNPETHALYNESLEVMKQYAITLKQAQAELSVEHASAVYELEVYLREIKNNP